MTRQNTSQTIYKHHGTDDEAGDAVLQHHHHGLASSQTPKIKKKWKNHPLRRPRGLRLPSGAKVMHNGQWVGLNEWGRAAAALRVRPEAIEITGGHCVLSTKRMLDALQNWSGMEEVCDICCMEPEDWFSPPFHRPICDGEFGTRDWVAPADDPLSLLAQRISRELDWRSHWGCNGMLISFDLHTGIYIYIYIYMIL